MVTPNRIGTHGTNGFVLQTGCIRQPDSCQKVPKGKRSSKPVSRVLYPGNSRGGDHLSSPDVTTRVKRPTRGQARRPFVPLFGLAPDGVYPADWSPSRW
jgi:hypothetical protein